MPAMRRILPALAACLVLGACHSSNEDVKEAKATEVPKAIGGGGPVVPVENPDATATKVKDRVATLGLLNKRNNEEQDLVMKSGEARRVGNVVVKLATCEKTAPWERPPETGAFVQVFVEDRDKPSEPLTWHAVFSGWLFKNSPSLNAVEHPVYDVWVKDCTMKFPGEEEEPGDATGTGTEAGRAAKPAGKPPASHAPAPAPSPTEAPPPA